jgi:sporadic carbohydrate cluster protein (TIGR04323 family)
MSNRFGYRGYIASRPVRGLNQPQNVQNLVIRDYAQRNGLDYLLSATEYAMDGCYMILDSVLDELPKIQGIICYSLFMLPRKQDRRLAVYDRILQSGATLHGALETLSVTGAGDIHKVEDMFLVEQFAPQAVPAGI